MRYYEFPKKGPCKKDSAGNTVFEPHMGYSQGMSVYWTFWELFLFKKLSIKHSTFQRIWSWNTVYMLCLLTPWTVFCTTHSGKLQPREWNWHYWAFPKMTFMNHPPGTCPDSFPVISSPVSSSNANVLTFYSWMSWLCNAVSSLQNILCTLPRLPLGCFSEWAVMVCWPSCLPFLLWVLASIVTSIAPRGAASAHGRGHIWSRFSQMLK